MMKWLKIEEEHLQQILNWRTSHYVTEFMYTDIPYNMVNQRKWLDAIREDKNGLYWVMSYKDAIIGYVSITEIDWHNRRGYWNFYIGDLKYSMLAGWIGAYMYNFAFGELGFEKLLGEVMDSNENVRKMHSRQGAREVGCLQKHVLKNDVWHDVYIFEMTKERWREKGSKFKKYEAEVIR